MKKYLVISLLITALCGNSSNLNAQTPFSPNSYSGWVSTPTNSFATIPAGTGVTFTQIARGSGNTFSTAADGINSSKWNNASVNAAITANQFLTFSVSANSAATFEIDSLVFILGRSNTGPDSCILQYKIAGAGTNFTSVASGVRVILSPAMSPTTTLSVIPASPILVSASDTLVFRLVAWHASSTLGTMKLMNNTKVYGKTQAAVSNSITAPLVQTSNTTCVSSIRGDSVQVTFNSIGVFNAGNTYSLELSDISGSFSTPSVLGTITSNLNNGNIHGFIPAGTVNANYRLRIRSSDPAVNGLDTTELLVNPGLTLNAVITQPGCPDSTGEIALAINGGSGLLEYDWSNGGAAQTISNLAAGNYSVTISDAAGCSVDSVFTIQALPAFLVTDSIADVLCHSGATGSVHLAVSGATAPYSISWSGNGINQTGLNAINLPSGTYLVSILDANNCPYTNSYAVTEPDAITIVDSIVMIHCNSESTGSIHLAVNGGTAPCSISWTGNGISQTGLVASNLPAGDYDLTILDANNCTFSADYTLTEPNMLSVSASLTHAVCAACNGTITLSPNGGTAPYSFLWDNNATAQTISGIPGVYCVEISDANLCELDTCFTISSTAGIKSQVSNLQIQIFPNPASDAFQIVFSGTENGTQKELQILNLMGEMVFEQTIDPGMEQLTVSVNSWARGVYTYRIRTGNGGIETGKIHIVH